MKVYQYSLILFSLLFLTYSYSQNITSLKGAWILETKANALKTKLDNKPKSDTKLRYLFG